MDAVLEVEAAFALAGEEPEGAALDPEPEAEAPALLVGFAAGRVELTTAAVEEGVKLAVPSSTVM